MKLAVTPFGLSNIRELSLSGTDIFLIGNESFANRLVYSFSNLEITEANKMIKSLDKEIYIIGGKIIYDITLDVADRLYITHIDKDFEGDVYFKEIDYSKYKKISERISNELNFSVYERIR